MSKPMNVTGQWAHSVADLCAKVIVKDEKEDRQQFSSREVDDCITEILDEYLLVAKSDEPVFRQAVTSAVGRERARQPLKVNLKAAAMLRFDVAMEKPIVNKKRKVAAKEKSLKA
ncbi:hypothetical protein [Lysobacter enzymogenes]|uniref:hypothetical protein n=1 Tax=Lysobacter enzymogenes TaxID=69 RepID=UPI001116229C|nr:hypothetical protein [Lysobacter enzymogenes]UZW62840.1 hypothetical protein BV903_011315 [Lysobacter enzymogenes]